MLTALFTEVKGLLKPDFWLTAFLPVAIVAFIHALVYAVCYPDSLSLEQLLALSTGQAAGSAILVAALLIIVAYVTVPLVGLFHGLLDGTLLPPRLHALLHWTRTEEWKNDRQKLDERKNAYALASALRRSAGDDIQKARAASRGMVSDSAAIARARGAVEVASKAVERLFRRPETLERLRAAAAAISEAISANTMDPRAARAAAKQWLGRLERAQADFMSKGGEPTARPRPEKPSWDTNAIEAAEQAVTAITSPPTGEQIAAADAALARAFLSNSGTEQSAEGLVLELDRQHTRLRKLLDHHAANEKYRLEVMDRRLPTLDLEMAEATRLGDARRCMERYSQEAYGAPFNWLWPRLQLLITGDSPLPERLSNARRQIDFATLLLALIQTVPLVWGLMLLSLDGPLWLALAIFGPWPLLNSALYESAVRAQIAYGQLVEAAIDAHRFELLAQLRVEAPSTLAAERLLWGQLAIIETRSRGVNVPYAPRPQGAGS